MIGYYVHHQGDGHVTRAAAIADRLRGETVTGLSSRPRPDTWRGPWLELARDDDPPAADGADRTAGGALHWAPPGHPGLRERMAQIAAWVAVHAPRLVAVDVSVEVTVLVRAMGIPTVVMGMPGARHDLPHQLAYRLADAIIAPWPAWARVFGGGGPWRAKTHPVGAISRFDGRPPPGQGIAGRRPRVVVLSGRGGTELTVDMLAAAQRETPDWDWTMLGPPGTRWVEDPWALLCAADVVVTHAGQNAIADIAAARRPAVVIAQPRPHDEQLATARALSEAQLAVVRSCWPVPQEWRAVLEAAASLGGSGWERWSTGTGAQRAAAVLGELACAPL
jgi:Glycosyltransferase family 28 C-terminal domain